jgi:hypothetical protein
MLGKQYAFVRFMVTSHVNMSQIMILPNLNAKNGAEQFSAEFQSRISS